MTSTTYPKNRAIRAHFGYLRHPWTIYISTRLKCFTPEKREAFRNAKRAVTLVEILVAITILGTILIAIIGLLSNSNKKMSFSENTFSAIHIGNKVMEDLLEDARVNSQFMELLAAFPEMETKDPVVEAQSVYFRSLRSRRPPWGTLEQGVEGGIIPQDGDLYKQLLPFKVSVSAQRSSDSGGALSYEKHLAAVNVKIEWDEKDKLHRDYNLPMEIFSPSGPIPEDKIPLFDESSLSIQIRNAFFPLSGTTKSLDEIIQEKGLDRELVYSIGKLFILTYNLSKTMVTMSQELSSAIQRRDNMLSNKNHELENIQLEIADKCETGASLIYNIMRELVPSFRTIKNRATPEKLGLIDFNVYGTALSAFTGFAWEIPLWVTNTGKQFEWLLTKDPILRFSSPKKDLARNKSLEALRLLFAIKAADSSTHYGDFIKREKRAVTGKNPFLERFYLREEKLCADSDVLKKAFPNLNAITENLNEIWGLASSVPELLKKHPNCP